MRDSNTRHGIVYRITCLESGKSYVGISTKTLAKRWAGHVRESRLTRASRRPFLDAVLKYGEQAFFPIVLEEGEFTPSQLCELERKWIRELGTLVPAGYNATEGGDGTIGHKWRPEQYKKNSGSWTPEKRIAAWLRGKHHGGNPDSLPKVNYGVGQVRIKPGQVYQTWEILTRAGSANMHSTWNCRCTECGSLAVKSSLALSTNRVACNHQGAN